MKQKRSTSKLAGHKSKRHSRPLHRRFLLHPIAIFALLIIGVLITGLSVIGNADSTIISATIEAPALPQAATITSPNDGAAITTAPVVVSGTCPPNSYVDLMRDGQFSGVAICSVDQTYSISTDLSIGQNSLMAQDYNVTNEAGPVGTTKTIEYRPPVSPTNPQGQAANPGEILSETAYQGSNLPSSTVVPAYDDSGFGQLVLSSKYIYESFESGHEFNWGMDLVGGTPPYSVTISWGDNSSSNLIFNSDPTFNISHNYKLPNNYTIRADTVDAKGVKVVLQLLAVIRIKDIASTTQGVISPVGPPSHISSAINSGKHWLRIIWPTYAAVLLMVISFWLGEREEYRILGKRRHTTRRA